VGILMEILMLIAILLTWAGGFMLGIAVGYELTR